MNNFSSITMLDCVFCKIVKGEIPSYKVAENDKYLAILDLAQFTEGHTIVIPKKHYETVWDIPDPKGYFKFIQEVAKMMKKSGAKYVDSLTFGRMVLHAHYHLVPHNNDKEWVDALNNIYLMQCDKSRWPDKFKADIILSKLTSSKK